MILLLCSLPWLADASEATRPRRRPRSPVRLALVRDRSGKCSPLLSSPHHLNGVLLPSPPRMQGDGGAQREAQGQILLDSEGQRDVSGACRSLCSVSAYVRLTRRRCPTSGSRREEDAVLLLDSEQRDGRPVQRRGVLRQAHRLGEYGLALMMPPTLASHSRSFCGCRPAAHRPTDGLHVLLLPLPSATRRCAAPTWAGPTRQRRAMTRASSPAPASARAAACRAPPCSPAGSNASARAGPATSVR